MCWLHMALFLHERRLYELQCIVLTGCVNSKMQDLTRHFTVPVDLSQSSAGMFRQFEGPVYEYLYILIAEQLERR